MTKNTFQPRDTKGKLLPAVDYVPLIFIAGTETHRLALHREPNRALPDEMKDWVVSEPTTGMKVCSVTGTYKGLTMASRSYGPRDARNAAMACLDALLERVGSDKFNTTIAQAKAKWLTKETT